MNLQGPKDYEIDRLRSENVELRAMNKRMLEVLKNTKAAILEGAHEYILPAIESVIARAERK